MEFPYKIVNFNKYCSTCKHYTKKGNEEPCDDCLASAANLHSEKPIHYEMKEETDGRKSDK